MNNSKTPRMHITCPYCGRQLCKAQEGSRMEILCPKCKKRLLCEIDEERVISVLTLKDIETV